MDKILSISIAVYNVEKFLGNTLQSMIIDKKYMDLLEVIIVNDGSKDRSVSIAQQFVEKYPNTFRLIDKDNGGYGSTINTSIPLAKGKYYKLVDGDDWVDTEGLTVLIDYLKTANVDAVLTKYCTVEEENGKKKVIDEGIPFDGKEHSVDILFGHSLPMHFLAIKTSLLKNNNIHITEKCFYTDLEFVVKPLPYVKNVALLDRVVYMYRIGRDEQSVSIKSWQKNIEQAIKVTYELSRYYGGINQEATEIKMINYIQDKVVDSAINKYRILLSFPHNQEVKNRIKRYDNELGTLNNEIRNKCRNNYIVKYLMLPGMPLYSMISMVYRLHLKKKGLI